MTVYEPCPGSGCVVSISCAEESRGFIACPHCGRPVKVRKNADGRARTPGWGDWPETTIPRHKEGNLGYE
jgi:hypothetical protein